MIEFDDEWDIEEDIHFKHHYIQNINIGKVTCFDVAHYFLSLISSELSDYISNLRLQKLVYLAQGYHLAETGKPLFLEPIELWVTGPVIPILYHKYHKYKNNPLPETTLTDTLLPQYVLELCDKVYQNYGMYAGWKLREMVLSHSIFEEVLDSHEPYINHSMLEGFFSHELPPLFTNK